MNKMETRKELGKGMVSITNNVCNIRYNKANNWLGQVGEYKGFCVFENDKYAIRATWKLIRNYIIHDCNTIEKIITRFAPPCENNTENYISFVERFTKIKRDKILTGSINHMAPLISAMAKLETGSTLPLGYVAFTVNSFME